MKFFLKKYGIVLLFIVNLNNLTHGQIKVIPHREAQTIGLKVWENEGNKNINNLIVWHEGEQGPYLGAAHFTWYPKNSTRSNAGTFPELLQFLESHGKPIPQELGTLINPLTFYAPWSSRADFLKKQKSPHMQALRKYLIQTIPLQMRFVTERTNKVLPILATLAKNSDEQKAVEKQFYRLAATPQGRYAITDYLNLAGEGGFMHVLKTMKGIEKENAVAEFVARAKAIMAARVARQQANNSPANHARWLKGWANRLNTYQTFAITPN